MPDADFVRGLPKAELHLHIEGTLEPELMFELAGRNRVSLPFPDVEAVRQAYVFDDLQSFLDIYYAGCNVLVTERDFADLTRAYLERAAADGRAPRRDLLRPADAHRPRDPDGDGRRRHHAARWPTGERELGVTSRLILCFLRHLSEEAAMATLEAALPHRDAITAVGLDSSEVGHPPSKFRRVFDRARDEGFLTVAHAGEEGPPEYIREALDLLHVRRIDHGVRCTEDDALVARLVEEQVPLTVCPLSNVKLRVFPDLRHHNFKAMYDAGLRVMINSDDPAYFGGYVGENYVATAAALGLTDADLAAVARNSFLASFLDADDVQRHLDAIDGYVA